MLAMFIKPQLTQVTKKLLVILVMSMPLLVQAADKGLFWKLESPSGVTSYLFGTMHTDDNRITNFSSTLENALKSSDLFLMEAEPLANPSTLMMDKDLSSYLNEDEFDKVRELADFHSMHIGAAMRMKPWLLAVIFDLPKPQAGFEQDNMLMARAEELDKEVKGIETGAEHFGVMDSFNIDDQLVMLRAVLKRPQEEKEANFEKLMAAYLDGDSDKIATLDAKMTGSILPAPLWARMKAKLLDERNVLMATRTVEIANNKPTFIAVGASHLAGDDGLISAFKKAGFKLTSIAK
ncbi:MAG: TraB/GumN family protein [Methylophilaceae bacterium]